VQYACCCLRVAVLTQVALLPLIGVVPMMPAARLHAPLSPSKSLCTNIRCDNNCCQYSHSCVQYAEAIYACCMLHCCVHTGRTAAADPYGPNDASSQVAHPPEPLQEPLYQPTDLTRTGEDEPIHPTLPDKELPGTNLS
jgi:hypothetical protein